MRIRAVVVYLAAVIAALSLSFSARAQDGANDAEFVGPPTPEWMPYEKFVELPETNAGARVAWLIEVLKGGDFDPIESRVTQRVIDEVGAEGFRDFIAQAREATGWLFPTHIIESEPDSLTLYLRSAVDGERWVMRITTNPETPDRIDSLIVQPAPTPPIERAKDWSELVARFDATGYDYGISVWEIIDQNGQHWVAPIAAINDDKSLNISGAASLFVLGAATQKIAAGDGGWEDPVVIREALKSVPESPLRDTPEGVEQVVASLAGQMLQGDDTATDHLIDWIGGDRVQQFAEGVRDDSPKNTPFLTTRQTYSMKLSFDAEFFERYRRANPEARRRILAGFDTPEESIMKLWIKPQGIDKVGHFASSRELAAVLVYLRNAALTPEMGALREVLGANQQLTLDSGHWPSAAFTAGAEPGVLSVCFITQRVDGRWFVISVILNSPELPLNPQTTSSLMLALIELLQRI